MVGSLVRYLNHSVRISYSISDKTPLNKQTIYKFTRLQNTRVGQSIF